MSAQNLMMLQQMSQRQPQPPQMPSPPPMAPSMETVPIPPRPRPVPPQQLPPLLGRSPSAPSSSRKRRQEIQERMWNLIEDAPVLPQIAPMWPPWPRGGIGPEPLPDLGALTPGHRPDRYAPPVYRGRSEFRKRPFRREIQEEEPRRRSKDT